MSLAEPFSDSLRQGGRCDNWFHPGCVGISKEQLELLDVYICESCERSKQAGESSHDGTKASDRYRPKDGVQAGLQARRLCQILYRSTVKV